MRFDIAVTGIGELYPYRTQVGTDFHRGKVGFLGGELDGVTETERRGGSEGIKEQNNV